MRSVGIAWVWVLLGVYFAIASNGGSEIAPFAALACGYMAGRERLRAEVAENKREIDELVRAVNLGSERAKKAERERDELRRRIAEAERFDAAMLLALGIPVSQDDAFATFALVRLDAEEGK